MPMPTMLAPLTAQQGSVLDDWADALESGDYPQGRSVMANNSGEGQWEYCCLGVFCDVLDKRGLIPEGWVWNGVVLVEQDTGNVWSAVPPSTVMRVAFGNNEMDPGPSRSTFADVFARANDALGKSFIEIAHAIRDRTFFLDDLEITRGA